jgi:hypothetical protein
MFRPALWVQVDRPHHSVEATMSLRKPLEMDHLTLFEGVARLEIYEKAQI